MEYDTGSGIGSYGIISFSFPIPPFLLAIVPKRAQKHSHFLSFLDATSDTTLFNSGCSLCASLQASPFVLNFDSLLLTLSENTTIE